VITPKILPDQNLCLLRGKGGIDSSQIVEAISQCISHGDWNDKRNVLVDVRSVGGTLPLAHFDFIKAFVLATGVDKSAKHACVVSGELMLAFTEEWRRNVSPDGIRFQAFTNMSDACDWLGVDHEAVRMDLD